MRVRARSDTAAGQAPNRLANSWPYMYVTYTSHARNSIAKILLPAGKPEDSQGSLATIVGDADVANYDDDEEPETDEETANGDDEYTAWCPVLNCLWDRALN